MNQCKYTSFIEGRRVHLGIVVSVRERCTVGSAAVPCSPFSPSAAAGETSAAGRVADQKQAVCVELSSIVRRPPLRFELPVEEERGGCGEGGRVRRGRTADQDPRRRTRTGAASWRRFLSLGKGSSWRSRPRPWPAPGAGRGLFLRPAARRRCDVWQAGGSAFCGYDDGAVRGPPRGRRRRPPAGQGIRVPPGRRRLVVRVVRGGALDHH